jgi:RNA polymerase sigma factor (sigma-70 family)
MPEPFTPPSADFALLCEVIASVARSSGLPPDQAEDFSQSVQLRLLERNYAPLAAFSGRSSFRTYLTVVVKRLLLDWRNHRYGKWRPSSEAKRLGPAAVRLDRLMSRDGHGVEEAVAIAKQVQAEPDSQPLREMLAKLPKRARVQMLVPDDLEAFGAAEFDDPVEAEQAAAKERRTLRRLRRACRRLPAEERRILFLRFQKGMSIRAIAALLGTPDKPLYVRIGRIMGSLRGALASWDTSSMRLKVSGRVDETDDTSVSH